MCKFRNLYPDEVELRVAQSGKGRNGAWAQYLIYKDARVDQRLLDETVGPMRWQKEYKYLEGRLYCSVSIYDEKLKTWVAKEDVGTESNTEKVKGEASDAFKRACFNWGIGRELYTAPKDLFITLQPGEYTERDGKVYPKNQLFDVAVMDVDENKRITHLVVIDKQANVRFEYPRPVQQATAKNNTAKATKQTYRQHPTKGQIMSMAKRIAAGEDLTDNIQTTFLMSQQEWMWLDAEIRKINPNYNK